LVSSEESRRVPLVVVKNSCDEVAHEFRHQAPEIWAETAAEHQTKIHECQHEFFDLSDGLASSEPMEVATTVS